MIGGTVFVIIGYSLYRRYDYSIPVGSSSCKPTSFGKSEGQVLNFLKFYLFRVIVCLPICVLFDVGKHISWNPCKLESAFLTSPFIDFNYTKFCFQHYCSLLFIGGVVLHQQSQYSIIIYKGLTNMYITRPDML